MVYRKPQNKRRMTSNPDEIGSVKKVMTAVELADHLLEVYGTTDARPNPVEMKAKRQLQSACSSKRNSLNSVTLPTKLSTGREKMIRTREWS